jgi:hypothetical protein
MSLVGKVVAQGNDIRQLKQNRMKQGKRVLHWQQDQLQKAKACDEMLDFEKLDPKQEPHWPVSHCRLPDQACLDKFDR